MREKRPKNVKLPGGYYKMFREEGRGEFMKLGAKIVGLRQRETKIRKRRGWPNGTKWVRVVIGRRDSETLRPHSG